MFRRRNPLTVGQKIRKVLWPRRGLRRSWIYIFHRIKRLPGTPYAIAAGVTCGAAISLTPLVGFHFLFALVLAWAIRANVVAALLGTAVGNPWTFPFIWVFTYYLGGWILGTSPGQAGEVYFLRVFQNLMRSAITLDADLFLKAVWPVWRQMMVGALPLCVLMGLLIYLPFSRIIALYQKTRREMRKRRRDKKSRKHIEEKDREETVS